MSTKLESPIVKQPPSVWHAVPADEIAASFDTDLALGLSSKQATQRLAKFGANELRQTAESSWVAVLARQFWDALTLILVVATALSVAVGDLIDAATIGAIIILNGLLGFVQEWKAEKALAALHRMLRPQCTVIRDGSEQVIARRLLVPGDLVQLETGDNVPADLRIVRMRHLRIDESALTGESVSVEKRAEPVDLDAPLATRHSMAWMGTIVTAGRALGVVVATGGQSQFGRISSLTEAIKDEITPLQRKMGVLGRQLGAAAITIATFVGFSGWWLGKPLADMFLTGISLAVAIVPEGLPAVVTMTMALGVRSMVRKRALLRRLQAAESLGAATVICTDKTGTLTQNQMTVTQIWLPAGEVEVTGVGYDPAGHFEHHQARIDYQERSDLLRLLHTGMQCNHAKVAKSNQGWEEVGEPTEGALLVAGYKAWLEPTSENDTVTEFDFDSNRKRMTVVKRERGELVAHAKGAPEVIVQRCSHIQIDDELRELTDDDRRHVDKVVRQMASQGLRTLALARRQLPSTATLVADEVESKLTLLGVVGMLDPPRPEVPVQSASPARPASRSS